MSFLFRSPPKDTNYIATQALLNNPENIEFCRLAVEALRIFDFDESRHDLYFVEGLSDDWKLRKTYEKSAAEQKADDDETERIAFKKTNADRAKKRLPQLAKKTAEQEAQEVATLNESRAARGREPLPPKKVKEYVVYPKVNEDELIRKLHSKCTVNFIAQFKHQLSTAVDRGKTEKETKKIGYDEENERRAFQDLTKVIVFGIDKFFEKDTFIDAQGNLEVAKDFDTFQKFKTPPCSIKITRKAYNKISEQQSPEGLTEDGIKGANTANRGNAQKKEAVDAIIRDRGGNPADVIVDRAGGRRKTKKRRTKNRKTLR